MGGRYLVTGTQLGMLITLCRTDAVGCNKLINDIIEQQQIGESDDLIRNDLKKASNIFEK